MHTTKQSLRFTIGILFGTIFSFATAFAWTGPSASAPQQNVDAPINVGSVEQLKEGPLGVDDLAVYGNTILNGVGRYLNWGSVVGTAGYGIRDNAGILEFKNNNGSWAAIASSSAASSITGSGTLEYSPLFSAAQALGNSLIQDTGTAVNIPATISGLGFLNVVDGGSGTAVYAKSTGAYGSALIANDIFAESDSGIGMMVLAKGPPGLAFDSIKGSSGTNTGIYGKSAQSWGIRGYAGIGSVGVYGASYQLAVEGDLGSGSWGVYCNATYCGGNRAWTNTSDERLKTRIQELPETDGLDAILKLQPVRFHWKDARDDRDREPQLGFIAQDVERVLPELVLTDSVPTEITLADGTKEVVDHPKAMSYATVVVPLVKAVQQLEGEIATLQEEDVLLNNQLTAIQERLK